jgi:hypothetical protein
MNLENRCSCAGQEFSTHVRLGAAGFKAESKLHFASATSLSVSEKSRSNSRRRGHFSPGSAPIPFNPKNLSTQS